MGALFLYCSLKPGSETSNTQAWTYWNRGPGAGKSYLQTDENHEWSASTGRTMANNLVAVARALQANPMPAV